MDEEKIYWRVGLFVLLAVIAASLLWWITGPGQLSDGHALHIRYHYTGPIKPGAFVRVSGMEVGRVTQVEFVGADKQADEAMVELTARIKPDVFDILTENARFYVTTMGVLGEYYLDIEPKRGGKALQPNQKITGQDLPRSDLLLARAAGFMEVMDALLVENRQDLIGAINNMTELVKQGHSLLDNPDGNHFIENLNNFMSGSQKVIEALALALGDGTNTKETLKTLPIILKRVKKWEQEKGETLADVISQIQNTLNKADELWRVYKATPMSQPDKAARLVNQTETTLKRLEKVSLRAEKLLKDIENKDTALGQLAQDKDFAKDLKDLVKILRTNPKSLFFK